MSQTERYDREEDRCNDKKTHDNTNHPSDHTNEKDRREADERAREIPPKNPYRQV